MSTGTLEETKLSDGEVALVFLINAVVYAGVARSSNRELKALGDYDDFAWVEALVKKAAKTDYVKQHRFGFLVVRLFVRCWRRKLCLTDDILQILVKDFELRERLANMQSGKKTYFRAGEPGPQFDPKETALEVKTDVLYYMKEDLVEIYCGHSDEWVKSGLADDFYFPALSYAESRIRQLLEYREQLEAFCPRYKSKITDRLKELCRDLDS